MGGGRVKPSLASVSFPFKQVMIESTIATVTPAKPMMRGISVWSRAMGSPSLLVALDYLELLADVRPGRFDRAAVRWHGRPELETPTLTVAESQLVLTILARASVLPLERSHRVATATS